MTTRAAQLAVAVSTNFNVWETCYTAPAGKVVVVKQVVLEPGGGAAAANRLRITTVGGVTHQLIGVSMGSSTLFTVYFILNAGDILQYKADSGTTSHAVSLFGALLPLP